MSNSETYQLNEGGRKERTVSEASDERMYHLVCKDRFDNIDKMQKEVLDLLRGKNGDAGLLDEVRTMKRRWTAIFAAIAVLGTAAVGQLVHWVAGFFT